MISQQPDRILTQFFSHLRKRRRLTLEEERELARRIEQGRDKVLAAVLDSPFAGRSTLAAVDEIDPAGSDSPATDLRLTRIQQTADSLEQAEAAARNGCGPAGRRQAREQILSCRCVLAQEVEDHGLGLRVARHGAAELDRLRQRIDACTGEIARYERQAGLSAEEIHAAARKIKQSRTRDSAVCRRVELPAHTIIAIDGVLRAAERRVQRLEQRLGRPLAELQRICERARTGAEDVERAKLELVEGNLPLVVSHAKRYRKYGLDFQDLIQEGSLGLITAADKYDLARGVRFATLAAWWIRQAISRALANNVRTIRLPVHTRLQVSDQARTRADLAQKLGRDPTTAEIAERLEVSVEQVEGILVSARDSISLDAPVGNAEDASSLGDIIEDQRIPSPLRAAERSDCRALVEDVLGTLKPIEQEVIRRRFGLDSDHECTLREIGEDHGVTREWVRQIESKAFRKLRHCSRAQQLRPLFEGDSEDS